ncbi:MAG TPA: type III-B CRISPR module RAMP protein Cmr1 [Chloroflexota bacterium]|nr:type III-B CRISPR module RAMP protein Cmr1 [Chloroflexota bacterium]
MPNLRSLAVTLETVTPLFLAGAQPRAKPELRPPAFRGALRYWLRAALGGALGDNAAAVGHAEAAVFGSPEATQGGASAVTVRLRHGALPEAQAYQRGPTRTIPREGRPPLRQPTGRDYLYWSMAESGNRERGNWQAAKQYYPAESTQFTLELGLRPGARDDALNEALAALWLLVQLGGVGSRSRRTAGSLSVREGVESGGLRFALAGSDPTHLADELGAGLCRVREQFAPHGRTDVSVPTAFDVLHPAACGVWLLGVWPTPRDAVEAVGAALRDFRTYREPDHQNVARWLQGAAIPTVERAAFGLPIPYRYANGSSGTVQAQLDSRRIERRASPLWLHVSRTTEGKGVGIATLFRARFLPEGAQLAAGGGRPTLPPPSDYQLIERWITESFPNAREARYV